MAQPIERARDKDAQRSYVTGVLAKLQFDDWWGTITIKLEKGDIRRVEKNEVLLLPAPGTPAAARAAAELDKRTTGG